MQLEESQIEEALDELRKVGAVALVQGDARIDRYRHLAYEWLGVEKVELAVMAELLLRGANRRRAAGQGGAHGADQGSRRTDSQLSIRWQPRNGDPVSHAARPRLRVTHTLYLDREMDKVRREAGALQSAATTDADDEDSATVSSPSPRTAPSAPRSIVASAQPTDSTAIAKDLHQLRDELIALKREFAAARADFESTAQSLRQDLDELNRQLGN